MMEKNTNSTPGRAAAASGYSDSASHAGRHAPKKRKTDHAKSVSSTASPRATSVGPTGPDPASKRSSSSTGRKKALAQSTSAETLLQFPVRIKPPPPQPQDAAILARAPHTVAVPFDEIAQHPLIDPSPALRSAIAAPDLSYDSATTSVYNPIPVANGTPIYSPYPSAVSLLTNGLLQRPGSAAGTSGSGTNYSSLNSSKEGTPDYYAQSPSLHASEKDKKILMHYTEDHPQNRRGFRYTNCKAARTLLPAVQYSAVEVPPYMATASYFDRSPAIALSKDVMTVSTLRGFSTARANVFVREGHWYYETKIIFGDGDGEFPEFALSIADTEAAALSRPGTPSESTREASESLGGGSLRIVREARHVVATGHIRLGLARREACLQAPVGFDGYGYGLRDTTGEAVHFSRPRRFFGQARSTQPKDEEQEDANTNERRTTTDDDDDDTTTAQDKAVHNEPFGTGDVIGLHVYLPPISSYMGKLRERDGSAAALSYATVSRDRIPIKYKGQLYFESLEYQPVKAMEDIIFSNKKGINVNGDAADPGTDAGAGLPAAEYLETIPGSYIDVYKNGRYLGRAFSDLKSFMPPSSKHGHNKDLAPPSGGSSASNARGITPGADGDALDTDVSERATTSSASSKSSARKKHIIFSPDDGQLGYYPTISAFKGGVAQFNFGPHFDFLPSEIAERMRYSKCSRYGSVYPEELATGEHQVSEQDLIRPMCERYDEQIAEDIVYDLIDEVEFSMQE